MIEHVEAMKDRVATIYPIVREHMEKAQKEQQASYNRPAQPREFQPGDRVLVLVPTVECKFLATWQGPYEIIERVGEVNYRVRQPGRRKSEQTYHVNLLKKWHSAEVLLSSFPPKDSGAPPREDFLVGPDLSPQQRQVCMELVDRNQDVFSVKPGTTHLAIREEIKKMLELGVIEESHCA